MKKLLALGLFAALSTSAFAGYQSHNAQGGNGAISTVAQAKQARDDAYFSIAGKITSCSNNNERCTFQDSTGTIRLDVDDDAWMGRNVNASTPVRISGQVDRNAHGVELDVESIAIGR